jgi:hypothetical protein
MRSQTSHAPTLRCAGARSEEHGIRSLQLAHVRGDPRSRCDMQSLVDVSRFRAAIVVCGKRAVLRRAGAAAAERSTTRCSNWCCCPCRLVLGRGW